ncbi:MAG: ABC transporter permease, partial [Candidatus Cyclobacteriaceae bacterium M2_1C_046]
MISNFLRLTLRNIKNSLGYTFINVLGLSVGLFAAILIFLYVHDELSFDQVHPKSEKTYRIGLTVKEENAGSNHMTQVPAGWVQYLVDKYEGVEAGTGLMWYGMPTSLHYKAIDKIILTEELYWVNASFQEVLHFPVIKGNKDKALEKANNIVISKSAAKQLFGDEDPIGKGLSLKHSFITNGKEIELTVSAVMDDYPSGSHIRPKYLVNMLTLKPFMENYDVSMTALGPPESRPFQSYIVVKDPAVLEDVQQDLQGIITEVIQRLNAPVEVTPFFTAMTDMHFDTEVQWTNEGNADIKYIYVFISIAVLILIVACINYMNLATARSADRAKEVGMRKVLGAVRKQLF